LKAISTAEMERSRKSLRQAVARNRIEGQFRSPVSASIFETFIHGSFELDEMLPRLLVRDHDL
jgi:hypothetical protein